MKFSALIVLALTGLAASSSVPTFTWLENEFSPSGVPLLSIDFHDGQPADVALLKQYNPIPKQVNELEENIDKCIFNGHLRDESKVYVTLTGGCPFDSNFDVMFNSDRAAGFMFQVKENKAESLPSIFKSKSLVFDQALKPPIKRSFKNPPPANALNLKVELNYDQSFLGKFGDNSGNTIRKVATHAANMYTWSSLGTTITWVPSSTVYVIENTIEASNDWLNYVAQYNNAGVNSNVYMAYQNDQPGVAGLAWVGTICSSVDYRTAISEYFNNDMTSAEILAHEVGHNTGMNHDFEGSPGSDRYDSQGRSCTDIGGVMDYFQPEVNKWTSCSVEDFNSNDHSCL